MRNLQRKLSVARGEQPTELLFKNVRLVNVLSGEIHPTHIAVDGWPTPNVWLEPEAMVCAAAGDRDAATPRQARRRTPGSRIWIFMVPPAGARAVPGDTERMAINRNELAAAIVVARPHSARFGYRRGNLGARC